MTALSIAEAGLTTTEAGQPAAPTPRMVVVRPVPPLRPAPALRPAAPCPAAPIRAVATSRAGARQDSAGPVRLTRRGRVVLGGLVLMLAAAAACMFSLVLAGGALASSHGPAGAGYQGMRQVVVQPGQTLWSIAAAAEPAADPRLVIPQIMETNSLTGATVYAGEQLSVPER